MQLHTSLCAPPADATSAPMHVGRTVQHTAKKPNNNPSLRLNPDKGPKQGHPWVHRDTPPTFSPGNSLHTDRPSLHRYTFSSHWKTQQPINTCVHRKPQHWHAGHLRTSKQGQKRDVQQALQATEAQHKHPHCSPTSCSLK